MEREIVRRRMNTISGHFVAARIISDDIAAANTHLLPLNCSGNFGNSFTRLDSRLYFGRQSSAAQGYFMRQAASQDGHLHLNDKQEQSGISKHLMFQNSSSNFSSPFTRLDSRLYYGRQSSAAQGYYMRQAASLDDQSRVCSASNINEDDISVAPTPPLFSRPAKVQPLFYRPSPVELNCSNTTGIVEAPKQNQILPSSDCPRAKFARPGGATSEGTQSNSCRNRVFSSDINGTEWSPRINVIESKSSYLITVELPGVDISDIRVEMNEKNMIVKGKRSMKWSTAASFSNDSVSTCHRMEISQGPYQVVLPIPAGANTDSVFADFVDGMLQITVPKC